MAKHPASPPVLRFHAKSKQHYVWLGRSKGGRLHMGRDYVRAQERYERFCREWRTNNGPPPARSVDTGGPGPTVTEVLTHYYRHRRQDGLGSRDLNRIKAAARFARRAHGDEPAATFRAPQLKQLRAVMLRAPSRRRPVPKEERKAFRRIEPVSPAPLPLSRRYVNRMVADLKACWTWAASEDLVPAETAMSLQTVKGLRKGKGGREVSRSTAVDPAAVAATLPELAPIVRDMVRLQQLAGMRPGELCALRRRDVSIDPAERVPLPETDRQVAALRCGETAVWVAVPESHKTLWRGGKPRVVVLGPKAQEILRPYLERDPDAHLFSPREVSDAWRVAHGRALKYGTGREPGDRYTTQTYGRAVGYAVDRASRKRIAAGQPPLPRWRPNQLRKAAATEAAEQFDRSHASAMLGNSMDVIDVYVLHELRKAAETAAAIG